MKLRLYDAVGIASILALTALAVFIYPDIPEKMPIHWNTSGVADGHLNKSVGVTLFISLPIVILLILKLLPRISPQEFSMEKFRSIMGILTGAFTVALSSVGALALIVAAGQDDAITVIPPILSGSLFVVVGCCLGRTTKNFFIGIRTPWTLGSDAVWERTHRIAGGLFLLAGLATMSTVFNPMWFIPVLLSTVGTAALVSVVFSFFSYRKLHGFRNEQN